MREKIARNILGIKSGDVITHSFLKKKYHRACLRYHPDKNTGEDAHAAFLKVQEAFSTLSKLNDKKTVKDGGFHSYWEVVKEYMGVDEEMLEHLGIITGARKAALQYYKKLDVSVCKLIYTVICRYRLLLHINQEIISELNDIIREKEENTQKNVVVHTDIDSLFRKELMVCLVDDEKFYVPLWHHHVEHESSKVSFDIVVDCSGHINIDEENDVHIHITKKITELLEDEKIVCNVGSKEVVLTSDQVMVQKYQIITLEEQGIPRMDEEDIYNADVTSNIIIHLTLIQ